MNTTLLQAFDARTDLADRYKHNAILLYALELRFGIDDIHTVAAECLTDGSNDRKCDAVYIDRDAGQAIIAQSYFAQTQRDKAKSSKAADLGTAATWVIGGQLDKVNDSLKSAAEEFREAVSEGDIDDVELWFCHNLPQHSTVQEELSVAAQGVQRQLRAAYPGRDLNVRGLEVGIERMTDWYQSTQHTILVADELEVAIDGWFEEVGPDWSAICVSVPAKWLSQLQEQYQDKLFSANVRGYMPSRKTSRNINFNIENTARESPGHFWAYNNGITALVIDYHLPSGRRASGQLRLNGIAIVNGAQTTGALHRSNSPDLGEASVLARFVKCGNSDVVDDIIRFNNSQNPILPSDFRSTDRQQERLRREFRAIPDSVYRGARRGGQLDRPRRSSNEIGADTVAQALAAFHGDPGLAYNSRSAIWERDEYYARYFSDATTAPHVVFAWALLKAVQDFKADLRSRANLGASDLAEDEESVLSFFRQRGAHFLLTGSISHCMEIVLGQHVTNRYGLSFGSEVSPQTARELWAPVVSVLAPFCSVWDALELGAVLKNRERLDSSLNLYRTSVRAWGRSVGGRVPVLEKFTSHVVETHKM